MAEARSAGATLTEAQDRFIAAWGQMGAAWGISRTMAEVHALLYISGQPLNTDEVMERLQISRGNASMSVRALLDWGVVQRTHKRGDRKEYFISEQDVWTMFRAIVRERLKREIDPTLAALYEIRDLTGVESSRGRSAATPEEKAAVLEHNKRLDAMLQFFQTLDKLSQRFVSPAGRGLQLAATMLNKVS
jgi:DNA-binding transcriptional regulator GbsR (MarR family)